MTDADRTVLRWRIGALVFVKLATSVIILYYFPSWHAALIVLALSVPWFFAGGYWAIRVAARRRQQRKLRQLRERLIREEWCIDEQPASRTTRSRFHF